MISQLHAIKISSSSSSSSRNSHNRLISSHDSCRWCDLWEADAIHRNWFKKADLFSEIDFIDISAFKHELSKHSDGGNLTHNISMNFITHYVIIQIILELKASRPGALLCTHNSHQLKWAVHIVNKAIKFKNSEFKSLAKETASTKSGHNFQCIHLAEQQNNISEFYSILSVYASVFSIAKQPKKVKYAPIAYNWSKIPLCRFLDCCLYAFNYCEFPLTA